MASYLDIIDRHLDLSEIGDTDSILERLIRLSPEEAGQFALDLRAALPGPSTSKSSHAYVGNTRLSGHPYPCSDDECRAGALGEGAAFAAIYADEFVLFNPLAELELVLLYRNDNEADEVVFKFLMELATRISHILTLRPLIDRGICSFVDTESHWICPGCFAKGMTSITSANPELKGTSDLYFLLADRFNQSAVAYVEDLDPEDNSVDIRVEGLADLIGHDTMYLTGVRKLGRTAIGRALTAKQLAKLALEREFAHHGTNDIVHMNSVAARIGVRNMVSSPFQISTLKQYFGEAAFKREINPTYPILAGNRLEDILRFRDQEWHHLHDFRQMVDGAVASGEDVDAALDDGAAKIARIAKKNVVLLNRKLAVDGAVAVLGATATVATAGIATAVAFVVAALSSGHLATSSIPALVNRFSESPDVRDERTYYAWKIRKKFFS